MDETIWAGRLDGEDTLHLRLFQKMKVTDAYTLIDKNTFFIHGFAVDEGVRRNHGRIGAAAAPDQIRKNMVNFPIIKPELNFLDFGNIECTDGNLEVAQENLSEGVFKGLERKGKSIVLGGGHEVTYAHYNGVKKAYPKAKIGVINFDAHFDNRVPPNGLGNSGTGFWQIAQQDKIHSLHLGIQRNSNTQQLFRIAHNLGMSYILADELFAGNLQSLMPRLNHFMDSVDVLYLTIDMDGFNASIAPGVSAPAYNGYFADYTFMSLYRQILQSTKLVALDVAEVNPTYDIQNHTARLAASLVNEWFMI